MKLKVKNLLLLTIGFFLDVECALSQTTSNKFSLHVPSEWKHRPKFLFKLAEILRKQVPQLADKFECYDCNAAYHVRFYMSDPQIHYSNYKPSNNSVFITYFTFDSFINIEDSTGKVFHRIIITDSDMVHTYSQNVYGSGRRFVPVQNNIGQIKAASARITRQLPYAVNIPYDVSSVAIPNLTNGTETVTSSRQTAIIPPRARLLDKIEEIIKDLK